MSNRGHNGLKLQQILPQVSQVLSGRRPSWMSLPGSRVFGGTFFVAAGRPSGRRSRALCGAAGRSPCRRSHVLGGGCTYQGPTEGRSPRRYLPGSRVLCGRRSRVLSGGRTWWEMSLPGSQVVCGRRSAWISLPGSHVVCGRRSWPAKLGIAQWTLRPLDREDKRQRAARPPVNGSRPSGHRRDLRRTVTHHLVQSCQAPLPWPNLASRTSYCR